eukprot:symbB.v1.2.023439.t1/scaffold2142.1/size88058/3
MSICHQVGPSGNGSGELCHRLAEMYNVPAFVLDELIQDFATRESPLGLQIKEQHREECEKLSEEHQYIETTLSTASHASGRKRLPAVIGACISNEPVADCEAEVRSYMERTFQEGCRDGHPEGHLLWAQWLSKALEDAHKQEGVRW